MEHTQHFSPVAIRKGGVAHVEPRSRGGECEDVTALDAVRRAGDAGGWNHVSALAVEALLHRADLAEDGIVLERRVAPAMLAHEPKWTTIYHATQLGTQVAHESAALSVGDPFAEVVEA